ncbi:MAG: thiamine pyrophosphate-binding protein [Gammaproteobacteria bacterium]|nr:thiamine pyrophosphate-binding protein [Gammaproteobacteria bacterium]
MRGSDLVAHSLASAGVRVIFSLSGNQIMPIYDACIDAGIRIIHTRHEGAAVYMAEAHAQLTGQPAVAMVTAGPGFTSSLGPLCAVRAAESPVLLISGDSPLAGDGKGCFQELDQVGMSSSVTKLSLRATRAENLGFDIALGLRVAAAGRPGPVHLALPFDLLQQNLQDPVLPAAEDFRAEVIAAEADALQGICASLARAERPLILTGPAMNPTRAPWLLQLADVVDTPVVAMESPRGLKDPCLGNFASVLAQADVILLLGKIVDHTLGFAQPPAIADDCRLMVVDPDTDMLDRARRALGARLLRAHRADAGATARALIAMAPGGGDRSQWRARVAQAMTSRPDDIDATGSERIHPALLCAAVQNFLQHAKEPVLIIDGGEFGQWAQACVTAETRIINGPSGCIGGSICYALAAKIARPGATVLALLGDGTAGFHFSEFETAHRYGVKFIAVIGHDARWNAEYLIQQRDFGEDRIYESELDPTRYDLAAAGFGCHGEHVTDPAKLDAALRRAADSVLPTCLVCEIDGQPAPSAAGH